MNSWNHIAITFKDAGGNNLDTMKFYINGAQVLTVNRLFEPLVVSTDSIRAEIVIFRKLFKRIQRLY
ncbi:MAG: hypothetical protein IPI04_06020 [Ignavibacteria bacterium]|nr:hypothetical protein [Ignavibacteria bacterium]